MGGQGVDFGYGCPWSTGIDAKYLWCFFEIEVLSALLPALPLGSLTGPQGFPVVLPALLIAGGLFFLSQLFVPKGE